MDRRAFYKLRHNIRASGWKWNWGSRCKKGDLLAGDERFKSPALATVASTIPHPSYDLPADEDAISHDWMRFKGRNDLTNTYWRNRMRANVRNDRRVFTEQLTHY